MTMMPSLLLVIVFITLLPFAAPAASLQAVGGSITGRIIIDFEGLPDGEYELIAEGDRSGEEVNGAVSPPYRVAIEGADVNRIELKLIPLSSLAGRVVLAADSTNCQIQQRRRLADIYPIARRDGASRSLTNPARPAEEGEFAFRSLEAGRYWLSVLLPHNEWYLRAITQPGPKTRIDASRQGFTLQPGERKSGLILTVAEGAAMLVGKSGSGHRRRAIDHTPARASGSRRGCFCQ
jgi:hypothetical protein